MNVLGLDFVTCFKPRKIKRPKRQKESIMTKNEKMELATMIAEAVVAALKSEPTSAKNTKKSTSRGNANEGKKPETTKKVEAPKTTKYSTSIKDYEPKKDADGHYIWGRKTDTVKSKHYLAMQKAYCYAVATKGKALTSDECHKNNIEVDYEVAYNKAKDDFKKKYVYVAKNAR
jgi:DNA mismatch repair ATPase MutL